MHYTFVFKGFYTILIYWHSKTSFSSPLKSLSAVLHFPVNFLELLILQSTRFTDLGGG